MPGPSQGEVDNKIPAPDAQGPQCAPTSRTEVTESADGSLVVRSTREPTRIATAMKKDVIRDLTRLAFSWKALQLTDLALKKWTGFRAALCSVSYSSGE